ncbi:hypothetical protein QR680_013757 [Steinernema hermaphroditum]|uniref:Fatty-acid and retinol-binding protein 1 n=1 Tax=Steinernema hermaphroditum TaxID=289476 RepID=A0AA39I957_9BILA|nr:hypothetical protein QR680_013757 [Steinernema hermaphroditum]
MDTEAISPLYSEIFVTDRSIRGATDTGSIIRLVEMSFGTAVSLVVVLIVGTFALPIPSAGKEKELYDVLPDEVKRFFNGLSEENMKVFDEIGDQLQGKDDTQIYELIKAKDPELAGKTRALFVNIERKIDSLSEAPKKFMNDLLNAVEHFTSSKIEQVIGEANDLSDDAKDEIVKVFPSLKPIFNS